MGQKVHPYGFRLGIIYDWKSRWFNKKRFRGYLKEDTLIRGFIFSKLNKAGLGRVEIERSMNLLRVIIHTSRPGLIIGRGGTGVEQLKSASTSLAQRRRQLNNSHRRPKTLKQQEMNSKSHCKRLQLNRKNSMTTTRNANRNSAKTATDFTTN